MLSFMHAYFRYNHIQMDPQNAPKISFMSNHENYCYNVMSFDHKTVGATYQRLMDAVFIIILDEI